jgi:positive regulator of sigma E activity
MVCENCPSRDSCETRPLSIAEATTILLNCIERVQHNQMTQQDFNEVETYLLNRVDRAAISVLAGQIKRSFHK